jgi:hypothetical protein
LSGFVEIAKFRAGKKTKRTAFTQSLSIIPARSMKLLSQIILLGLVLLNSPVIAQEVGNINDPDGYTNIREGQSSNTTILAKLVTDERFLYYPTSNSSWWKVIKTVDKDEAIEGYVHKSRIQPVYNSGGDSNMNLKRIYHEFHSTASSFRTSKRDIDPSNLPSYYFVETIDEQGRVVDLRFMANGEIIKDHLCYLAPWKKFEYPNPTTIILYNLYADGSKVSDIECEMWYKTTYTLNDQQTRILNAEIEYSIDTAAYLNDYGWTKEELMPVLESLKSEPINPATISGYIKSTTRLNGKFPIGEGFDLKNYSYTGLEFEELKKLME